MQSSTLQDEPLVNFRNAIITGDNALVKTMLQSNFPVNMTESGKSSLYWAVWYGQVDVVKTLLAASADPNIAFPLYAAQNQYMTGDKSLAITKLLLEAKALVNATTCSGETALFRARLRAEKGPWPSVEYLVSHGALDDVTAAVDGDTDMNKDASNTSVVSMSSEASPENAAGDAPKKRKRKRKRKKSNSTDRNEKLIQEEVKSILNEGCISMGELLKLVGAKVHLDPNTMETSWHLWLTSQDFLVLDRGVVYLKGSQFSVKNTASEDYLRLQMEQMTRDLDQVRLERDQAIKQLEDTEARQQTVVQNLMIDRENAMRARALSVEERDQAFRNRDVLAKDCTWALDERDRAREERDRALREVERLNAELMKIRGGRPSSSGRHRMTGTSSADHPVEPLRDEEPTGVLYGRAGGRMDSGQERSLPDTLQSNITSHSSAPRSSSHRSTSRFDGGLDGFELEPGRFPRTPPGYERGGHRGRGSRGRPPSEETSRLTEPRQQPWFTRHNTT